MKFGIDGREYEYDGKLTVKDGMFLFEKAKIGMTKLNDAIIIEGNPIAIAAWMFILKRRAGEAVRWDDMLELDLHTFKVIPDVAEPDKDEDKGGAEASDPTSPNGKTRRRATSRTS